ncbi:hypothetical protein EDB81DRAFT_839833 [Dactylonectria macrodidyma]|uniref:Uncharacterized protein n=1 Tax=Dactylonectria macrodidyma TaxID=307937 RepID=A0A9P9JDJ1_9HYPO|nr:hypothetical protein EDB81DRAFT_839833 [Dactylonectria macrodidyma]
MSYFGPHLEPSDNDLSVWTWLFNSQTSTSPTPNYGFRDGTTGDFLSHVDLKNVATAASIALAKDYGLTAGLTVAIVSRNSIWYPAAMLSVSRLGGVVTLLPPEAKSADLAYYFESSRSVLIFADTESMDQVRQASQSINIPESRIISLDGSSDETSSLHQLIARGNDLIPDHFVEPWKPLHQATSPCGFLCFSSGTTGRSKAVMISHNNVISQLRQMQALTPHSRQSTVLGILPFYHITGLVHLILLPILLHQNIVILAKFDMKRMMDTITNFRCNELWLVPPLLVRLLNDAVAQNYDLSFVEQFNTGAAPLTDQIIGRLATRFPNIRIRQAWGMTETTSCLTVTPPHLATWANANKVGKLVPGTDIRVVDPNTGIDVPKGEVGELWAKGPQITMGYLNRPNEQAETYVNGGFLRTGDLGSIDGEGFVTIHDRIKEMIKVRGHGVAPAELEDFLLGHPLVSDVAVIGIPHEYSGEVPKAYVVVKPGVQTDAKTERQLLLFVERNKARHKRLSGGVEFIAEVPRSAAGKILRRVLKDRWKVSQQKGGNRAKM